MKIEFGLSFGKLIPAGDHNLLAQRTAIYCGLCEGLNHLRHRATADDFKKIPIIKTAIKRLAV